MIDDPAAGSDKNVDSSPQLVGLFVNVCTSVNGQNIILTFVVFKSLQLLGNLECELSGWGQDHSKGFAYPKGALTPETRYHGKTKGESLSRPSKVSDNQVFFIINSPERAKLYGEHFIDATSPEALLASSIKFRKIREVTRIVSSARLCRLLLRYHVI